MSDPILVLEDGDLVVMYDEGRGRSWLVVLSQSDRHKLAEALDDIRRIAGAGAQRDRVQYRPPQQGKVAHIIVFYHGELDEEVGLLHARAFVQAIKKLG